MMPFDWIVVYVLMYPSIVALLWLIAAIYYHILHERIGHVTDDDRSAATKVTIMVPCYNEGSNIDETIQHLLSLRYDNYDVLLINDGSSDDTAQIIDNWAARESKIKALHQKNQGKATALNNGLEHATGDVLVCIDGDAVLDYDAIAYLVKAINKSEKIGVITGNPRVRNRSTILGRLQVTEFSSIIGLLKRAQSIYGTIFTISGVIGAFRKSAIQAVGGWSPDMITEDIDVSWKLQMAGYDIVFEPNALCWVLMPETIRGLFKQRLRWAQGGAEVFFKYIFRACQFKHRRFWPLLLEYLTTVLWAYSLICLLILGVVDQVLMLHLMHYKDFDFNILRGSNFITVCVFLLQFMVSLFIDSHYERGLWRSFIWCIWYPFAYWTINLITMVWTFPKAFFRKKGRLAVWVSPDRGV